MIDNPALRAVAASGLVHEIVEYGEVHSVAEAAAARGIALDRVIKTIVLFVVLAAAAAGAYRYWQGRASKAPERAWVKVSIKELERSVGS